MILHVHGTRLRYHASHERKTYAISTRPNNILGRIRNHISKRLQERPGILGPTQQSHSGPRVFASSARLPPTQSRNPFHSSINNSVNKMWFIQFYANDVRYYPLRSE